MNRTNLRAYSAALAILQVHFHGNGLAYDSIRTIQPALKTAGFILLRWRTSALVYHRAVIAPVTSLAPFTDAW
jgi:hypothetical protein